MKTKNHVIFVGASSPIRRTCFECNGKGTIGCDPVMSWRYGLCLKCHGIGEVKLNGTAFYDLNEYRNYLNA